MRKMIIEILLIVCLVMVTQAAIAAPIGCNLLVNPGFEDGLSGWETDHGYIRESNPLPHSGNYYLAGGKDNSSNSYTSQRLDLLGLGFTAGEIDGGLYFLSFGGYQSGWQTQKDSGLIEVRFLGPDLDLIGAAKLDWFYSNHIWVLQEGTADLVGGTRFIDFGFYAKRYEGYNNDGYLDDAFLKIDADPVPVLGGGWLLGSGLVASMLVVRKKRGRKACGCDR